MEDNFSYRLAKEENIDKIHQLIFHVFNEFVGFEYSKEGREEFYRYIEPVEINKRLKNNHFILFCNTNDDKIVGMIEIRGFNHVSLLFVDKKFQKQGIAKILFKKSIEICRNNQKNLDKISVNSSRYAVLIYEKLGFRQVGVEEMKNGIRFIPMVFQISG